MLIEFSVANFRSIAGQQTLSLVADTTKNDALEPCFVPQGSAYLNKFTLLKSGVAYGPNASGKSNLLKALGVMQRIVRSSAESGQRGDVLPVVPFKLDEALSEQPTEFEVVFVAEDVRYQYGFTACARQIHEEWLFAYPKGRPQNWFSRAWDEDKKTFQWSFGSAFTGEKQTWKKATRENALFLSTAVQLNSDQLKPVFDWFISTLRLIGVRGVDPSFTSQYCYEGHKEETLDFLKRADVGIEGLEVSADQFDPEFLPQEMPAPLKELIQTEMKDKDVLEVKTQHHTAQGKPVAFDLEDESSGTQKLFAFAGPWLDTLKNGYVLFVDELHDQLHPKLVQYLVELFHHPETNPHNAQLFFTTHETSIMNQSVFRRDQIWFLEKDEHQATQLFPLTDFSPRKGRENLESAYLSGRYGAVPFIDALS